MNEIGANMKVNINKKKLILGICFLVVLLTVFAADDIQQKKFKTVRQGYEYMRKGQYSDAIESFERYLDVDSSFYWKLIESDNDYFYTREGVAEAIQMCLDKKLFD